LDHVGDERHIEGLANAAHLLNAFGRLDEDQIGAGLREGLAAPERLVEPKRRSCVRARDDEEILGGSRFSGNLDLANGILERNDTTARRVPALFGILLVLQLDARSARRFVTADGEIDVQQATIPRVAVSDYRGLRPLG